jgi:hypothetical protein
MLLVAEDFKIKSTAKIVWLGGNLLLIILPNPKKEIPGR